MTNQLIGSFIFINQGYGNLSSIYQNNHEPEPFPEIAKKKRDELKLYNPDVFEGIYEAVWLEPGNHIKAELTIIKRSDNTYKLEWCNLSPNVIKGFEGLGMLHDGKLIGHYTEI